MAWTHGSTGSVFCVLPLSQDGFFFRKQVAENELTEREEDARKNAPLFSSGEGLCGQEGMTVMPVMAMETGIGTTEPRQASADCCAAQPKKFS